MVDAVYAEIRPAEDGWREVLRSLAETTRQAVHQHEWLADLIGGRPQLGPHALARGRLWWLHWAASTWTSSCRWSLRSMRT
jgi:hypothetical protein